MLIADAEFREKVIGMPVSHAEKFMEAAHSEGCIIISRAVGPTCLQPLEFGYDTKGFRIHGKSCDWGPMAGFVMRDPRLNKAGTDKIEYNRKEHRTALEDTNQAGWNASTTPLKIPESRVRWLVKEGKINYEEYLGLRLGVASHSTGVILRYALIQENTDNGRVWGVYLDQGYGFKQEAPEAMRRYHRGYEALLAMTNPPDHRAYPEGNHLNAITGDYDLFAIWPKTADYQPQGADRRVLGTVHTRRDRAEINRMEADFVDTPSGGAAPVQDWQTPSPQSTKLGNITDRVYRVSQVLNSLIAGAWAKTESGWRRFERRNVCWHSTESARPYVNDVDLPLIAFVPDGMRGIEAGIRTMEDFQNLIALAERLGFRVMLNEGWLYDPLKPHPNQLPRTLANRNRVPTFQGGQQKVPAWYNR